MRRPSHLILLLALSLILSSLNPPHLTAQERDLSLMLLVTPLPGQGSALEEGMAEYLEDFRDDGIGTPYSVWEIVTGENTGSYYLMRADQSWSTIGTPPNDPDRLGRSVEENIEPHVAKTQGSFWRTREDLGYRPDQPQEPVTMIQFEYIRVHPSDYLTFESSWREVKEAAEEEEFSGEWSFAQLTNGGRGITYRAQVSGSDFADFEQPDLTLGGMLVAKMGERAMERTYLEYASTIAEGWTEMIVLRPDLSFLPEG